VAQPRGTAIGVSSGGPVTGGSPSTAACNSVCNPSQSSRSGCCVSPGACCAPISRFHDCAGATANHTCAVQRVGRQLVTLAGCRTALSLSGGLSGQDAQQTGATCAVRPESASRDHNLGDTESARTEIREMTNLGCASSTRASVVRKWRGRDNKRLMRTGWNPPRTRARREVRGGCSCPRTAGTAPFTSLRLGPAAQGPASAHGHCPAVPAGHGLRPV